MSELRKTNRAAPADHRVGQETTKVVLMELTKAGGPISAMELADRTLLSETAVNATLNSLAETGICTVFPGNDRRPTKFGTES